jgi:hypothetical protein
MKKNSLHRSATSNSLGSFLGKIEIKDLVILTKAAQAFVSGWIIRWLWWWQCGHWLTTSQLQRLLSVLPLISWL